MNKAKSLGKVKYLKEIHREHILMLNITTVAVQVRVSFGEQGTWSVYFSVL